MKKKMVTTTMTAEQWSKIQQQIADTQTVKAEVAELQDAVVELADIVAGGDDNG